MASRGSGSGSGKGKGKKASGSTRGKGRMPLDGEITERISTLRMANTPRTERLRRNLASPVLRQALQGVYSEILGGYIQSYELDYQDQDGCSFVQGRIFMESPRSGEEGFIQHDATFVVMDEDYETGRIMAQKIYDTTINFHGYNDVIADIYLVAYCETLGKWVIGYEPFCQYWLESTLAPFYESDTTISAYWRDKIREMTESISYLCTRKVSHGGLANRESYVLDLDSKLKLINVARYSTDGSTTRDDVVDFFDLLCTEDRINASGNGNVEWEGFDYLIKSNSMYNTRFGEWKQAILNHPILKDHSAEKLACYLSIHKNAQGMSRESLTNFSNALLCKIPD
ncbi:hypothetical protein EE612_051679 [Oryza sativa]|nr:hypothetical protein EE612_051679 [Oryza sativa]